jgi:phage terminase Nu1 subunit (DNA packaging protein)
MMFIFGAAVGSVVTWQYTKKKYEQITQEEIDSVKETFSKLKVKSKDNESEENNNARTIVERAKDKPSIVEYAAKLRKQGYTNYSNTDSLSEDSNVSKEEVDENMINDKPYVISPDEFGEFDDYEKISLTYYADQVLADEDDELVEDIEETVGFESLNAFGEYEDDSVFVRNDRLKCDYEILLDQRKYSDVIKRRPHEVEDYK